MNEEDKFIDRVQLVLSAILFGGLLLGYYLLLKSSGISLEWRTFWTAGLMTYFICLFAVRKDLVFKKSKSKFKNKIIHYLFLFFILMVPVAALSIFFRFIEALMPLDIRVYGFGGAGLAVIVSIFTGEVINRKNRT